MKTLLKAIDTISEWSGKLVALIFYAMVGVLVWEVVMRYAFNAPTIWAHGVSLRIFAAYSILAGAYVLLHKGHIAMDLVYSRFPLRTKAIVDLVTAPLFFAFCGVLLWYGSSFAWTSLSMLEPCYTPFRAPIYPVKLMVPVGAFLILLQGLAKYSRDFITAISGRQCEY